MPQPRKITQLTACGPNADEDDAAWILFAVADDGTAWKLHPGSRFRQPEWEQLPSLPPAEGGAADAA
jgi:hypothetical protein